MTSTVSGSSDAAEATNYLSAASSTSLSYTSPPSSADVKLSALFPTAAELEHMIITKVVVLRKGIRQPAANETNDTEMVMGFSADSEEKDMLLLYSDTAVPPSIHEA